MAETSMPRTATWQSVVDWDHDDDFDGTAEDVSDDRLRDPGLTIEVGLDGARALAPPRLGTARCDLNNVEQTYSAEFPGSPIYLQMLPGRAVEHRATIGGDVLYESDDAYDSDLLYEGTVQVVVHSGELDDVPPDPARNRRRVGLVSADLFRRLRGRRRTGRRVSTELYSSITTGTAFGHLADAVGWPAGTRSFDTGSTTLLYWWLDDEDPWQAMLDLVAIEGPQANSYLEADTWHFEGRDYRSTASRSTTSQVTFEDHETDGGVRHIVPLTYDAGHRNIINACSVETVQRTLQALAVVWTYGATPITLTAGETRVIRAKPSDPFSGALCASGTDVTASSGSIASVTLSRTSGGNTDITIVAGGGGATLNLVRLRAQALTASASALVGNTVDASDSIDRYEQQDLAIDARREIDPNVAIDLANAIVQRYQEPLPAVTFTVLNIDFNHVYQQVTRKVSDRVTLVESHTGIDWDVHINSIVHRVGRGGFEYVTTFGAEKAPLSSIYRWDDAAAVWDTAVWGA